MTYVHQCTKVDSYFCLIVLREYCSVRLSWFTEWIIRNKSSLFDESPLKCMVSLPFFLFRIPRLKTLMLLNTGWPVSLNLCTILLAVESHSPLGECEDVPYHFFSDPRLRNVQCPGEDLFAKFLIFCAFGTQISSLPFLVQSMSLNIDMKMIRSVNSSGSMLFLFKSRWISWRTSQWRKSWQNISRIQFLLHRFPQVLVRRIHLEFFHLTFPSCYCFFAFIHLSPHIELSQSRHALLLLSTWPVDHETILISSMR